MSFGTTIMCDSNEKHVQEVVKRRTQEYLQLSVKHSTGFVIVLID